MFNYQNFETVESLQKEIMAEICVKNLNISIGQQTLYEESGYLRGMEPINSKTDMDRTLTVKQTWTEHKEFQ